MFPSHDPTVSEGYEVKMEMTQNGNPWNIPAGNSVKLYDSNNVVFHTLSGPQPTNYIQAPVPANTLIPQNHYTIKGFILSDSSDEIIGNATFSFTYDPSTALIPVVTFERYDSENVRLTVSYSESIPDGFTSFTYNPDGTINNKVEGPQSYDTYTVTIDKTYLTFAHSYTITVKLIRS